MIENFTNSSISQPAYNWTVLANSIFITYINRIIGGIGIILNILFVVLLTNKKLKHSIYNFLLIRQFVSLITCFLVTFNNGSCFGCNYSTLWLAYYSWYNTMFLRNSLLASFITGNLLILNRYFEIIHRKTFLNKLSKKLNLIFSFLISLIICSPSYFAINVLNGSDGNFKIAFNNFGQSPVFQVYIFVVYLFESIIPLVIFLFLNIASILKFKNVMNNHANLTRNQIKAIKAEKSFTKMTLIISSFTSVVRLIDLFSTLANRIIIISPSTFSKFSDYILFGRSISSLIINLTLALDGLVYLSMDNNIRALIMNFIRKDRVSNLF